MPKAKTLADKLLIKPGVTIAVVNPQAGLSAVEGAVSAKAPKDAGAVLLYAVVAKDAERYLPVIKKALAAEARLWVAYPKAGKLKTDLHRDLLAALLEGHGFEGVRLVSIDDTWSAMGFRRAAQ
jgi:hypothetical protein